MDNKDRHIAGLWEEAKQEAPQRSLEETKAAFSASLAQGGAGSTGGESLGKGFSSIINLNSIIMSSVVIMALGLAWSLWSGTDKPTAIDQEQGKEIEQEVNASGYGDEVTIEQEIEWDKRTIIYTGPVTDRDTDPRKQEEAEAILAETEHEHVDVATSVDERSDPDHFERKKTIDRYIPGSSWDRGGSAQRSKAEVEEKQILFVISNNTRLHELEEIKERAQQAGVKIDFRTRGEIRWINLKMSISNEHGNSETTLTMSDEFEITIGWLEDEDGRAIRFSAGDDEDAQSYLFEHDIPFIDSPELPELPEVEELMEPVEGLLGMSIDHPGVPDFLDGEIPELLEGQERVLVHIDRNTSDAEIEEYKRKASSAGLELELVTFKRNGKKLKVMIKTPEMQMHIQTDVDSREEDLAVDLGWVIDEDGAFVRFLEREEVGTKD